MGKMPSRRVPAALLLLPVLLVPLIHLFVSTSTMRREAEHGLPPTRAEGFQVIPRAPTDSD